MTVLHYLNVGAGDCTIIQHPSGRVTMVDICGGNLPRTADRPALGVGLLGGLGGAFGGEAQRLGALAAAAARRQPGGNFGMGEEAKNPLDYLGRLQIASMHRFISTHPEMDHMDGLDALFQSVQVANFWHTGVWREAPDFGAFGGFNARDWGRYCDLRNGQSAGTLVVQRRAGDKFPFANQNEDRADGGDALHILAPTNALVQRAEEQEDINESSYVLALWTPAGWVVIPGDAHDATWEHVLSAYGAALANCALLLAPHHGRDSDRDYAFLDQLRPRLTLMGCAPAEHMGYASWRNRNLPFITNNQAGDVCVDLSRAVGPMVWVENEAFAQASGYRDGLKNAHGQSFAGIYQ